MTEGIAMMYFLDEQQRIPVCYCNRCGGAIFGPSLICIRCQEDSHDA